MKRFLAGAILCAIAIWTVLGCGGGGDDRSIGTTDTRIVGSWVASQIQYEGQTQPCPGDIMANNADLSCVADDTTFTQDGHYSVGTITDDYFFDGTYLTMYNRSGNSAQFLVSFDPTGNIMTWTYNLNGDQAVITVNRVTS